MSSVPRLAAALACACAVLPTSAAAAAPRELGAPQWRYALVSRSYRPVMAAGSSQLVTVTLRNRGRRAWELQGPKRMHLQLRDALAQPAGVSALRTGRPRAVPTPRAFAAEPAGDPIRAR